MKLLMTTDVVGGVWTYSLQLASALESRGHEVVLAAMGGPLTDDHVADLRDVEPSAWESRPYRLEWMPDAWADAPAAGEWLLELASDHGVDVVHLNGFAHGALPWERPVIVVAHSDVVTWWRAVKGDDPPAEWARYRGAVAAGLAAADLVVAPSAAMRDALGAAYGLTTPPSVIHNGLPSTAAEALPKEPLLVSAGRVWDEAKNVATAAAAAECLPWPLAIAGEGELDGARTLGRLGSGAMRRLFARASVFVAPALYEPFGLAALEAGAAGCALILGDIPSLREVWGNAATFVPPHDARALRRALHLLIDDDDHLAWRQAAATRRARRYTLDRMAERYVTAYRRVAGARDTVGASR